MPVFFCCIAGPPPFTSFACCFDVPIVSRFAGLSVDTPPLSALPVCATARPQLPATNKAAKVSFVAFTI